MDYFGDIKLIMKQAKAEKNTHNRLNAHNHLKLRTGVVAGYGNIPSSCDYWAANDCFDERKCSGDEACLDKCLTDNGC